MDLESGIDHHHGQKSATVGLDGGVSDSEKRICRICHTGLVSGRLEYGVAIELGCSCKDDLASVHKQCAETWFKIKGNRSCEICHSMARNLAGLHEIGLTQQTNRINGTATARLEVLAAANVQEPRSPCSISVRNFIFACTIFTFLMLWFFHFHNSSQQ